MGLGSEEASKSEEVAATAEPRVVAQDGTEVAAPAPVPKSVESGQSPPPMSEPGASWLVWAAVGAGAALTAGGAVFAIASGEAKDRRDAFKTERGFLEQIKAEHDQAASDALIANVLFAAGGAVAIAGGVLLLATGGEASTDDAGDSPPAPEANIRVLPRPGAVMLESAWTFP